MKKIYKTLIAVSIILSIHTQSFSQTFWTEPFSNSCASGCSLPYSGANGNWTSTLTGTNAPKANKWFVSGAECGNGNGTCASACGSTDPSLHVGTISTSPNAQFVCPAGDCSATYDAGPCSGCVVTDVRAESPLINCSGRCGVTLSFNYIEGGQTTIDNATLWYYDGTNWTQLADLAKTSSTCSLNLVKWAAYSVSLPASANNNLNVKIGFRWVNNEDGVGSDPSFAVDDISLTNSGSTPIVTVNSFSICSGGSGILTASGTSTSFSWAPSFGLNATTGASVSANPIATTTYTVTGTGAGGCTTNTTSIVTVLPLPVLNLPSPPTPICSGVTGAISPIPSCIANCGGVVYTWKPSTGLSSTVGSNVSATLANTTTYTLTATNSSGCTTQKQIVVTVNPLPVPSFTLSPPSVCINEHTLITYTGTGSAIAWDFGVGSSFSILPLQTWWSFSGNKTITVIASLNGCTAQTSSILTVNVAPIINVTPRSYCTGGSAVLTASCLSNCGGINYQWAPSTNLSATTGASVVASPTVTTIYTVTGSIASSCTSQTTTTVTISTCACGTNAGTSVESNSGTSIHPFILCEGDKINITSNNNYILPPSNPGCLFCSTGLMYAIYNSKGPSGTVPLTDANFTGFFWTGKDFTTSSTQSSNVKNENNGGSLSTLSSVIPEPDNTWCFVPITADATNNAAYDFNLDGCYSMGSPLYFTFLNPITFIPSVTCNGSANVIIKGGYPEFFGGNFILSNTGAGNLNTNSVSYGGSVTISGLSSGQTYSFSVNDGNGCIKIFSGVYNGMPLVNFASSCSGGCILNPTITNSVTPGNISFSNNSIYGIKEIVAGSNCQASPLTCPSKWSKSEINVAGVCPGTWNSGDPLTVCLNINHSIDQDLDIYLQAPNGGLVLLSSDNGGAGHNYTNTCFTMTAANAIGSTGNNTAPFTGSYRPEESFNTGFSGTNINGVWKLWLADDDSFGNYGTLLNWAITFNNQSNLTYAWSPAAGLSATNILSPTACPTVATTYTLTVTNACGCTGKGSVAVTTSASITAGGPTTYCAPGSVTLTASSGNAYQWYKNNAVIAGETNQTYKAALTGSYKAAVTTNCGIYNSNVIKVTRNVAPTVTIFANGPSAFCSGGSVLLTSTVSTVPVNYQWLNSGSIISGATDTAYIAKSTGKYSLKVTSPSTGCTKTSSQIQVTVNPLPSASIDPAGNGTICPGDSLKLTAVTNISSTAQYQWKKSGGNINGATNQIYKAYLAGSYRLQVTNPITGCLRLSAIKTISIISCSRDERNDSTPLIEIYPNPTDGILNINAGELNIERIECYNGLGEMVLSTSFKKQLDLSQLAAGHYLIRFVFNDAKKYETFNIIIGQ